MIIEFVQGRELILVHVISDGTMTELEHLEINNVIKGLEEKTGCEVIVIPNGEPCSNNPIPKIRIFKKSDDSLLSAIKELCKKRRFGGEYIPLNDDEFVALARAKTDGKLFEI